MPAAGPQKIAEVNLVSNQLAAEVDEFKLNALARLELNQAKAVLAQRIVVHLSPEVISVDSSVGEYVGTLGSEPFAGIDKHKYTRCMLSWYILQRLWKSHHRTVSFQIQHQSSHVTGQ